MSDRPGPIAPGSHPPRPPDAPAPLPFSRLQPAELPTLEELGIELGVMLARPFGRDEQGEPIGSSADPVTGVLVALQESVAERVAQESPADLPPTERSLRIAAAQEAAIDELVRMLNAAQPDPRFHITRGYLQDRRHRFSEEFWLFAAEYARRISGDRELVFRAGFHAIPPGLARVARPLGIEGSYRAIARLSSFLVHVDMQTMATSSSSATIRWAATATKDLLPPPHLRAYRAVACHAYRGGLAAVPLVVAGRPTADIVEPQCLGRGDAYCEWEVRWDPGPASTGRRALAAALLVSAGIGAVAVARPGPARLTLGAAAALLPVVTASARTRIGALRRERDDARRQLLEQRDLAEQELGIRSQTRFELQHKNLELEQRVAELVALNEVGRAVTTTLDLEPLLDASLASVVTHGRYARALVLLLDPERGVLTSGRSVGGTAAESAALTRYEVVLERGASPLARIFAADGPVLVTGVDAGDDPAARAFAEQLGSTSFLATPLLSRGRRLGVLAVDHGRGGPVPDQADAALLETIASLIASALERAQLYGQIERANRELEERVQRRTEALARATAEAEEARASAEAANEAKSRFLSSVSHELRTPLTSVLGFTRIIAKRLDEVILPGVDLSDPRRERAVRQVRDNLGIITAEGERLTTMINTVLDLARIEAGRLEWRDEPVDVAALVIRARDATTGLFVEKGLELAVEIEDGLPEVRGDADRLLQVLINLVSNAVKFTDTGSVTIRASRADGRVVLMVRDTGIGIAPEHQAAVFEPFRQVGDTLTEKPHGTGLGLPIAREIVEHHGGDLRLESTPGLGSTFWVTLPALPDPPSSAGPNGEPADPGTASEAGAGRLVLVADDDPPVRRLLRQALEARGDRVLEAADGTETLAMARERRPDVLILDALMPGLDGFEVAAAIRHDPAIAGVPILMLTVLDAADRARRAGVDDLVVKPFDPDEVLARLDLLPSAMPAAGAPTTPATPEPPSRDP